MKIGGEPGNFDAVQHSLGAISDAHLRNSNDLIERLKDFDFTDKYMASLDVKSLFTNVPVDDALKVIKDVVDKIDANQLPLDKFLHQKLVVYHVKTFTKIEKA